MKKSVLYLIAVVIVIAIAALAYVTTLKKPVSQNNNQPAPVAPVTNETAEQTTVNQELAPAPLPPAPVLEKINLEIMSEAEKKASGINPALKIQVVDRDTDGKVTAYKIIRQDSDILTEYAK